MKPVLQSLSRSPRAMTSGTDPSGCARNRPGHGAVAIPGLSQGGSFARARRLVGALSLLLLLAACVSDPASLGLTGGAMPEEPLDPGQVQTGIPGAPAIGTRMSPSLPANTGAGKFWGYN